MTNYHSPSNPDMFAPRYSQIATFMRTPLAQSLTGVDIGLVGIPYDGALTNRPGARHGPREVRNQSCPILNRTRPAQSPDAMRPRRKLLPTNDQILLLVYSWHADIFAKDRLSDWN